MTTQDAPRVPETPKHLPPLILPEDVRERTRKVLIDRPELRDNIAERLYEGAVAVLLCYLGRRWLKANVASTSPSDFLIPNSDLPGQRKIAKAYSRLTLLAECLLTMQRVPGIVERVEALRTKDVEGCFGELQGAMLLARARVLFEFRPELQRARDKTAGGNFDVVALIDGQRVNCEMKAKCEGTDPSESTLRTQLKKARSQLPAGEPNVVFLRLPETWMASPTAREQVVRGLDGHFRDSSRVTCIVVHWEQWTEFSETSSLHEMHYRCFPNTRAPALFPDLPKIIDSWMNINDENWFSLPRFVLSDEEYGQLRRSTHNHQLAKLASLASSALNFHFAKT